MGRKENSEILLVLPRNLTSTVFISENACQLKYCYLSSKLLDNQSELQLFKIKSFYFTISSVGILRFIYLDNSCEVTFYRKIEWDNALLDNSPYWAVNQVDTLLTLKFF